MTKDISIEYAHIYTNREIEDEHTISLEILQNLKREIGDATTSLLVMVDDYSFPDPTFNYSTFLEWLDQNGHKPDLQIRESQLIPICDEVLKLMPDNKFNRSIVDYVKTHKYPCSLFIAAWYLVRLGYLQTSIFPSELVAKKIINILPESFKPFEDEGLKIIRSTKFAKAADKIEYRFFEGRLIA